MRAPRKSGPPDHQRSRQGDGMLGVDRQAVPAGFALRIGTGTITFRPSGLHAVVCHRGRCAGLYPVYIRTGVYVR
jgi:hypothetical protein